MRLEIPVKGRFLWPLMTEEEYSGVAVMEYE